MNTENIASTGGSIIPASIAIIKKDLINDLSFLFP